MFNLTSNNPDREFVLDNLKLSYKLGDEIMNINADLIDLIKYRVEFQIKASLNSKELAELGALVDQVINFAPKHLYNFQAMNAQEMLQLTDTITLDANRSINETIRPRMILLSGELLTFLKK